MLNAYRRTVSSFCLIRLISLVTLKVVRATSFGDALYRDVPSLIPW